MILSTGGGNVAEVDRAVAWFKAAAEKPDVSQQLVLLHCVSGYPTPVEQANLQSIPFLAERYGLAIGWSNHVIGPQACIAAVALGARVVEIHVTDRREGRSFRDHALSFEPGELAELVVTLRSVRQSLGVAGKEPAACERDMRVTIRKGIVAARDLVAGTRLTSADIIYARPATEFSSNDLAEVVGQRLTRGITKGTPLPRDAVEPWRGSHT